MQFSPAENSRIVLVADDDTTIRALIATGLRRAGFEVIEAFDGLDALLRAARHRGAIHLLITDLEMPRLNGIGLCESLLSQHPETKILFITGSAAALDGQAGPVLQKPFRMTELLSRVDEILERRHAA